MSYTKIKSTIVRVRVAVNHSKSSIGVLSLKNSDEDTTHHAQFDTNHQPSGTSSSLGSASVRLKSKMFMAPQVQRLSLAFLALCATVFVPSDCNRLLLVDLGSNGDGDIIMPRLQESPQRRTKQGE